MGDDDEALLGLTLGLADGAYDGIVLSDEDALCEECALGYTHIITPGHPHLSLYIPLEPPPLPPCTPRTPPPDLTPPPTAPAQPTQLSTLPVFLYPSRGGRARVIVAILP